MRRYDHQLTLELGQGNLRLSTPSVAFGMCVLLVFSSPRSCPKDTAMTQQCGVETIWMVYVTELT